MKNRFFLFLLIGLLMASSCGRKGDDTRYKVIFSYTGSVWYQKAAKEFAQETYIHQEIDLRLMSSATPSDQVADLMALRPDDADLVIIVPLGEEFIQAVEYLHGLGVSVILYDHKVDTDKYSAFVTVDNYLIGQQIGDYTKLQLEKGGNILLIRGFPFLETDQHRYEGFYASMGEGDAPQKYKVIAELEGRQNPERTLQGVVDILQGLPRCTRVDAVVAFSDNMAAMARKAFDSLRFQRPLPMFVGVNALSGPDGGIEMVDTGVLSATFFYPFGGHELMELVLKILHGEPYEKDVSLKTTYVDKSNVKVVKLQTEQLEKQRALLEELNRILSDSLARYADQKTIILLGALVLALILIIFGILMALYRVSIRSQKRLNQHNQDLRSLAQELEEANKAKLQFFTNISHEFKTPLSLIVNPLDNLLEAKDLPAEERASLQMMQRNAGRLQALINEILDFQQYEAGKLKTHPEPVDLDAFLRETNALFSDIIRTKQVKFSYEAAPASYKMLLDKGMVEKIYFNLLSNAFKFVKEAGEIRIRMRPSLLDGRRMVEVSVFNSDSFITAGKLTEIFQRFYKIDSTDNTPGTGIGLALAAALSDAMEGDIKAASEEGIGTTFTFHLPFKATELPVGDSGVSGPSSYARTKLWQMSPAEMDYSMLDETDDGLRPRVLVIDDNADMRQYLKGVLKKDYFVYLAEDGREGIQRAVQILPQIIICDILMPGIDGYGVCKTLKQDARTSAIPVILLSACSMDEQVAEGFESGADAYIRKPFSAHILKVRIQKLIEKADTIRKSTGNGWLLGNDRPISSTQEAFLNKIKKYIEQHLTEEISIPDLVKDTCVSKSKFYRDLREITDYSPIDMINLIRIRRAQNLILSGGRNISQAALETGFSSTAYFSRVFLKYYKETPGNWVKRNRHQ